jgi:hypothetical protein
MICLAISWKASLSGMNNGKAFGGIEALKTLRYENYASTYQSAILLRFTAIISEILGGGWPKNVTCSSTITQLKISYTKYEALSSHNFEW